jgi:hypothetical protein
MEGGNMRTFELRKLPTRAGDAKIDWFGSGHKSVERSKQTLHLCKDGDVEFFPLLKGRQFVYRFGGSWFFGGTDENPFLVRLSNGLGLNVLRKGEEGFLDWLVPEPVRDLEKKWGVKAIRQGDWFAVKSPNNVEEITKAVHILYDVAAMSAEVSDDPVGDTRHRFTGMKVQLPKSRTALYTGTLSAPDHTPKDLTDGLYTLIQCDKLYSPKAAD